MSLAHLEELIKPYKPLKDINTIVVETNRIFHSYDAKNYDKQHPEIFEQLPPIYAEMCKLLPMNQKLRILDFGCGTGFEAIQLLNNLENIEMLCCYDISGEMLDICRQKIKNRGDNIILINNIEEIPADKKFNLLVTNSLLHHLPQPLKTIDELKKFLSNDCVYIMAHEPSARYYKNDNLVKANTPNKKIQTILKNLRRIVNIKNYPYYFKKTFYRTKSNKIEQNNPYILTAIEAVQKNLFEIEPGYDIIDKIVDCYVPHDHIAANAGQGFDFKSIALHDEWELIYSKTYNFLNNNTPYSKLNKKGQRKYKLYEERYPEDGLNFCCLWKRKQG